MDAAGIQARLTAADLTNSEHEGCMSRFDDSRLALVLPCDARNERCVPMSACEVLREEQH
jgi:hypothetical protein